MGHATPNWWPGATHIALERFTPALPENIVKAGIELAAYLAEAQKTEAAGE
jgi:hypothetical protein